MDDDPFDSPEGKEEEKKEAKYRVESTRRVYANFELSQDKFF